MSKLGFVEATSWQTEEAEKRQLFEQINRVKKEAWKSALDREKPSSSTSWYYQQCLLFTSRLISQRGASLIVAVWLIPINSEDWDGVNHSFICDSISSRILRLSCVLLDSSVLNELFLEPRSSLLCGLPGDISLDPKVHQAKFNNVVKCIGISIFLSSQSADNKCAS